MKQGVVATRKRKYSLLALLCLLFLVMTSLARGQDEGMIEEVGLGRIDWGNGLIYVVGYGAPPKGVSGPQARLMARGAAKADAYRNAAEVLNGVRVNSETYVRNYVMQSDEIRVVVEGFVQGARIINVNQLLDGTIELTIELPLGGQAGLTSLLNRPEIAERISPSSPAFYEYPATGVSAPYTGVIIDARNLGIKPALYPQVFDYEGNLLYAATMVNMARPGFTTIVAYARSVDLARNLPRLGTNPLVLTADSAVPAEGERTDLVLGVEATRQFRRLNPEVIKNGAVAFVID
ncbi:LPP20 family lipoprotein [Capillibacterium thermochitinicola]|uniref:LPP20 family lipoprotein n=1 Tax=Capillibacterium thermochitinicola TaxID=2699427 RepID=A0A8J6LIK6_9FIRM|nr:LPP20 family lipoprotein [Capillibacterium thermochitinicola]MBA2132751.1 LPP20 family lipoprotein [Capillibacterium thermochitinicola]